MSRPKKASKKSREHTDDGTKKVTFKEVPPNAEEDHENESSSEESDEEDEDAVLLTNRVENKIFQTLVNIKNKNPVIYDPNVKCFSDSDFDEDIETGVKKSKGLRYKDMVRETLLKEGAEGLDGSGSEGDDSAPLGDTAVNGDISEHKKSYQEEQDDLKSAFLSVADELDDDSEFFKKSSTTDVLPEPRKGSKKAMTSLLGTSEDSIISRYWSGQQTMDKDEEFLKDYILNQRWREDKLDNLDYAKQLRLEQEDEEHYNAAEDFEYKYNYRFEEAGGATIEGHPRNIEDSVRKVDDRRKKKRLEKKQKQKEEQIRRDEELKRVKNLKKAEIEKRMREIEANAGVHLTEDVVDLNAPFDPEQHERDMENILGSGYDGNDDDWNPGDDANGEVEELWWLCDHCNKGIPVGHKHFDCSECENYTLCEPCVPLANHEHLTMTAKVVPPSCAPPTVDQDQLAKLEEDYYKLDYEDMIGDLKVRFKYRQVQPYKCDVKTILEKTDQELNAMMPLSKLLTYDGDLPQQSHKRFTPNKRNRLSQDGKEQGHDRRMTKYNVNRDRLQAFGLKANGSKKKKHKSNDTDIKRSVEST
ncbi:zinc zz type domain-containing protein [Babesia ovis]|uniref:Zinc zz type domain-containing protein n=1 Tax=Babesia ovis TaxID=5869 RepID=A0A9W5WV15_BABOV|nr:zinc zz type domain-containing protein [Babesia ovis]